MKTKEEYLAMTPPYLPKERWERFVNIDFEKFKDDPKSLEESLEFTFNLKPRSLVDRWKDDARYYEKNGEKKGETCK